MEDNDASQVGPGCYQDVTDVGGETLKPLVVFICDDLDGEKTVFEVLADGSEIISINNYEMPARQYVGRFNFKGSDQEVGYSDLRLQPLLFQDDIARLCTSRDSAQAGNIKIEACLETKLLDPNTDKTVYIIMGNKNEKET